MDDQTSTLSDTELDRVTGGTHRDPGQKWEEKDKDAVVGQSPIDKVVA